MEVVSNPARELEVGRRPGPASATLPSMGSSRPPADSPNDADPRRELPERRFALARVVASALALVVAVLAGASGGPGAAGLVVLGAALLPRCRVSAVSTELGAVLGWVWFRPNPARWSLVGLGFVALVSLVAARSVRGRPSATEPRSWGLGFGLVALVAAGWIPVRQVGDAAAWLVLSGWVLAVGLALLTEGFTPLRALRPWGTSSVRERAIGRGSVARTVVAAGVATAADFLVFRSLLGSVTPALATLLGCVVGGAVNFTINHHWVFDARRPLPAAAMRYVWVSAGSAAFNSAAVALALIDPTVSPVAAWVVARALGFLGWNYPMQRDHVFAHRRPVSDGYGAPLPEPVVARYRRRAGR